MTTDSAYERVTRRLTDVTGWRPPNEKAGWRCPAHDDQSPSLSVTRQDDRVLIHCHVGCTHDAILAALDLKPADLFDTPANGNGNGNGKRNEPDATYAYTDEHGKLLFQALRYGHGPGKTFKQRRPDGRGGWIYNLQDTRRVLYRLPRILEAIRNGKPVFVVEGEKDVEAIERAGGVATCNPMGAGKWRDEYADLLAGGDIIIVPDQDGTGIKHAADVEGSLGGKARRVRVVEPAAGCKDAFDHLAAGHTLDDWLHAPNPRALERRLLGGLIANGIPKPVMVHRWLYAGGLHTIQSEPGVGKSWVALWLAIALMETGYAIVFLDEEGGEELVAERLAALGADPELVDRLFHYFPFPQRRWDDTDTDALIEVLERIEAPIGAGVLDSLPDFLAAADLDEDRAKDVTSFVHRILTPFRDAGAALIVLDHLSKPDTSGSKKRSRYSRGSGAKLAKAHLTVLVETVTEFDRNRSGKLRLWKTKDRRGSIDLPPLTDQPLILDVAVGHGAVEITEGASAAPLFDGPTHCMHDIYDFLQTHHGEPYSVNKLTASLKGLGKGYRRDTVGAAAARLSDEGRIKHTLGARGSDLYWVADAASADQGSMDESF